MTTPSPIGPATNDPLIGSILKNAYKVTGVIGQGGMGTVYRAEQLAIGREVAIKMLRRDFGDAGLAEQAAARFTREARVTSQLVHPNTVRVIDFGSTGGRLYLVLELLEGQALADVLQREVLIHPTRAAVIGRQVALSLTEAHAQGIIHRDIKPDNIFLCHGAGHKDFVKVVDFGIAGTREAASQPRGRLTSEHAVIGSAHYMSPEQAEGLNAGPPSDLYALGIVLYEMLTGEPPFNHDSVFKIMVMHATEEPARLEFSSNMPPQVAQAWRSLIGALLAKNPDDRPRTAAAVADELEWIREKSVAAGFDVGRLTTTRRGREDKLPSTPAVPPAPGAPEVAKGAEARAVQTASTAVHASIASFESSRQREDASALPPSLQTLDTLAGPADDEPFVPGRGRLLAYWGLAAVAAMVAAFVFWPADETKSSSVSQNAKAADTLEELPVAAGAGSQANGAVTPSAGSPNEDAPAALAKVLFDISPAGTEVLAGDRVWCTTPCSHMVGANDATNIAFRRAGHRMQSMTLPALKPGQVFEVKRTLLPIPASDQPSVGATDASPSSDVTGASKGDDAGASAMLDAGPEAAAAGEAPPAAKKKRKRTKKKRKFGLPGFRPSK